jgi:3'(2'), 5'-bisphosphate nucleotidase
MIKNNMKEQVFKLIETSIVAGKEILKVYDSADFGVEMKTDNSPLTIADKKANEVIVKFLETTNIPILSEEGREINYNERKKWDKFWLVDPLDGTKEFIKKNGEFTVNIALVEKGRPTVGVIYAPVLDTIYAGYNNTAFRLKGAMGKMTQNISLDDFEEMAEVIPVEKSNSSFLVVGSRSHMNEETKDFIKELEKEHQNIDVVSKGSSLKICLVAEGEANIYPRFGPTMEWDTGAGQAIIENAGGRIVEVETKRELRYNKENLLNPYFIVYPKN